MGPPPVNARRNSHRGTPGQAGWALRVGVALLVLSRTALAYVDITGGSPGELPNLAGAPRTPPPSQDAETKEPLVLQIVVNGTSLGEPSRFELRDGQLYAEPRTLEAAGIRVDDLKANADGWLALSSIPGLRATYSSPRQQAILEVTEARLTTRQIGYAPPPVPKATPGLGFVLNYDVSYTRQFGEAQSNQLGVWSEQRFFTPFGVFDNTGTWVNESGDSNRYTRLDTNWTYSNPAKLFTVTVGDTISGSLPWSRSVRFGGFQIQRDFSLRPNLITFPLPVFAGSAAVPSAVDLYINGLRQYSGEVAPGPFQIAQAPSLTGAGVAQVVVTDALGRRVTTSVPLYVDTSLLAQGLFNYSVEAGFLRDDYTVRSFNYESSPVFSGTLSYGVTDWLTLQAHTEGGQGLSNGGAGAVIGAGNYGAFSVASAGSRVDGRTGALVSAGYQYIGPRFSFSLQTTHATSGYRDVAALTGTSIFQHLYQATSSVSFLRTQSATVSYIDSEDSFSGHARVVTLAYNAQIGKRWSLFATTYRDFLQKDVWGGSIGITLALGGNTSISKTVSQSGGHTTLDVTASRPADFGGGLGWTVQGGAGADYRHAFGGLNYRTSFGLIPGDGAALQRHDDRYGGNDRRGRDHGRHRAALAHHHRRLRARLDGRRREGARDPGEPACRRDQFARLSARARPDLVSAQSDRDRSARPAGRRTNRHHEALSRPRAALGRARALRDVALPGRFGELRGRQGARAARRRRRDQREHGRVGGHRIRRNRLLQPAESRQSGDDPRTPHGLRRTGAVRSRFGARIAADRAVRLRDA